MNRRMMRMAGEGLNLPAVLVGYMGEAAQSGVQDLQLDAVIAERVTPVIEGQMAAVAQE